MLDDFCRQPCNRTDDGIVVVEAGNDQNLKMAPCLEMGAFAVRNLTFFEGDREKAFLFNLNKQLFLGGWECA
jgi:hypothetical protein